MMPQSLFRVSGEFRLIAACHGYLRQQGAPQRSWRAGFGAQRVEGFATQGKAEPHLIPESNIARSLEIENGFTSQANADLLPGRTVQAVKQAADVKASSTDSVRLKQAGKRQAIAAETAAKKEDLEIPDCPKSDDDLKTIGEAYAFGDSS